MRDPSSLPPPAIASITGGAGEDKPARKRRVRDNASARFQRDPGPKGAARRFIPARMPITHCPIVARRSSRLISLPPPVRSSPFFVNIQDHPRARHTYGWRRERAKAPRRQPPPARSRGDRVASRCVFSRSPNFRRGLFLRGLLCRCWRESNDGRARAALGAWVGLLQVVCLLETGGEA